MAGSASHYHHGGDEGVQQGLQKHVKLTSRYRNRLATPNRDPVSEQCH
jgi:hypothetical protein